MILCPHCLAAIESREGNQDAICFDPGDETVCDWCKEVILDDFAYEI